MPTSLRGKKPKRRLDWAPGIPGTAPGEEHGTQGPQKPSLEGPAANTPEG